MQKTPQIHFCLVSNQPTPNFIPIIDQAIRPDKVYLFVTPAMKQQADSLESILRLRVPQVAVEQVEIIDHNHPDTMEKLFSDYLTKHKTDRVVINLTGGTKLMSISLNSALLWEGNKNNHFGLYVDEVSNQGLVISHPDKSNLKDMPAVFEFNPENLQLNDYLKLHGYRIETEQSPQDCFNLPKLTEELIRSTTLKEELSALNHDITKATFKNKNLCQIPLNYNNEKNCLHLIELLEEHQLVSLEGTELRIESIKARDYIMGGWLEEYVYFMVYDLEDVQDVRLNIQIKHDWDSNIHQPNEIDVAFMRNNTLHLIECKTINFTSRNSRAEERNDTAKSILYKLESLKRLGGLKTQAYLISANNTTRFMRDRAKGARVELYENQDLMGLKTFLNRS